jgi:hypothetical protein
MGVATQGGSFGVPSNIRSLRLPLGNGSYDEKGRCVWCTVLPLSSRRILLFGSILSGVQNGKDSQAVPVNPVRNDIRCARHDELACFWLTSGAAEMGMLGKAFNGGEYALRHAARCCGLIPFDILPNFDEVGNGRLGPDYSHDGGGSSLFLPQERSHRAVFS